MVSLAPLLQVGPIPEPIPGGAYDVPGGGGVAVGHDFLLTLAVYAISALLMAVALMVIAMGVQGLSWMGRPKSASRGRACRLAFPSRDADVAPRSSASPLRRPWSRAARSTRRR